MAITTSIQRSYLTLTGRHENESSEISKPFEPKIGCIVSVEPRTWPGINKHGGVGRVTAVHHESGADGAGTVVTHVDVKYVLEGTEKSVDINYVKEHKFDDDNDSTPGRPSRRGRKVSLSSESKDQLPVKTPTRKTPTRKTAAPAKQKINDGVEKKIKTPTPKRVTSGSKRKAKASAVTPLNGKKSVVKNHTYTSPVGNITPVESGLSNPTQKRPIRNRVSIEPKSPLANDRAESKSAKLSGKRKKKGPDKLLPASTASVKDILSKDHTHAQPVSNAKNNNSPGKRKKNNDKQSPPEPTEPVDVGRCNPTPKMVTRNRVSNSPEDKIEPTLANDITESTSAKLSGKRKKERHYELLPASSASLKDILSKDHNDAQPVSNAKNKISPGKRKKNNDKQSSPEPTEAEVKGPSSQKNNTTKPINSEEFKMFKNKAATSSAVPIALSPKSVKRKSKGHSPVSEPSKCSSLLASDVDDYCLPPEPLEDRTSPSIKDTMERNWSKAANFVDEVVGSNKKPVTKEQISVGSACSSPQSADNYTLEVELEEEYVWFY